MKKILILAAVVLAPGACSAIYESADAKNPCSFNNSNTTECQRWKKDFPKEYEKYKVRMKKNTDQKTSFNQATE